MSSFFLYSFLIFFHFVFLAYILHSLKKKKKEKKCLLFSLVVIYVTAAALRPKLIDRTQYDINPKWQTYNCCIQLVLCCQFQMDAMED